MKVGETLEKRHQAEYIEPYRAGKAPAAPALVEREAFKMGKDAGDSVKRYLEDSINRDDRFRTLPIRTFDNIAQVARRYFGEGNPVDKIHQAIERMRVTGQNIFEKGTGPIVEKMAKLRATNPEQFKEFSSLLHDATVANVHPDVALSDAKNAHLGKNKVVGTAVWSKAQHGDLSKRYRALIKENPEYADMWHEVVKHFTDTQNEMTLGIIKNQVLKLMGIEDDALAGRIHEGTLTMLIRQHWARTYPPSRKQASYPR